MGPPTSAFALEVSPVDQDLLAKLGGAVLHRGKQAGGENWRGPSVLILCWSSYIHSGPDSGREVASQEEQDCEGRKYDVSRVKVCLMYGTDISDG